MVLFLVCPCKKLPPSLERGRGGSKGWMGLVTPSDFSTRLPFDFIPCEGSNLLGLGDFDCVCLYVLEARSVGRSENCFTRFLNWSWFLLTPLDRMGLDRAFLCVVCLVYRALLPPCGMSW
jgi:hypothetical protein